jgi:hypothetical protein
LAAATQQLADIGTKDFRNSHDSYQNVKTIYDGGHRHRRPLLQNEYLWIIGYPRGSAMMVMTA